VKVAATIGLRVAHLEAMCDQHSALLRQRPEKGDTGAAGLSIKGDKGEKGTDGASIKGERGDPGSPGRDGRDGLDGKSNTPGPPGHDGKSGRDGKDADTSVIEKAMAEIMSLKSYMASGLADTNHQRQVDLTACQNAIKEQNAEIAKLRNEMAEVRIMLTAMLECNTKAGEYVNFLRERVKDRLKGTKYEQR
jgi:hypothetical protein